MANAINTALGSGKKTGSTTTSSKYDNYGKAKAMAKEIAVKTNNDVSAVRQRATDLVNSLKSSSKSSSSGPVYETTPVYYSNGGSNSDDIVSKIKDLLNQQKEAADAYYKTLYEQQLSQNREAWESNRNQINKNYMRTNRYINNMYGDAVSGTGLSNRNRNYQNWNNNLTSNNQNRTNNDATALSSYNMGLANNASTLAQGWYNYVLPVYTNRQQNQDNYDYRRYLATLGI